MVSLLTVHTMKSMHTPVSTRWCSLIALYSLALVLGPAGVFAQPADPYTDKLKAGDAKMASGDHAGAAAEYESSVADAKTPTQRALASGKQALALIQKGDYAGAKAAADSANPDDAAIEAVAEVTILQALAKCQLQEKNYAEALESLTRADALSGVDWAKPDLAMVRGDAERDSGQAEAAVATYRKILEMPGVSDQYKGVAWLNIGIAEQYGLKRGAEAKEAYAKACQLNPGLKAEAETHTAKIQ